MFIAVVETGSFTAAAARLGTSSGQASKMVSRLEATLGVRLLNRTTRAVVTTEAGQAYFERVRALIEEFDGLDLSIRNQSQAPRGRLRLTAPLTFGVMELAPALYRFARQYPEIALDVSFTDRVVNLVDEGFDMAVRIGRPTDSSLIARRLCDVHVVLVAGDAYLERHGEPLRPEALSDHECIIDTNFREPERWPFAEPGGGQFSVPVSGRIRFSNAEACLKAAEAGLGMAYVPAFVAMDAIRSGSVRCLLRSFAAEPFSVHTLYPHSRHLAAKVRVLVDFLADHFRGGARWEISSQA
jgi:DNA-binding transcriptional LysR family regulator